jgi:nucleoid DNA-binding protein
MRLTQRATIADIVRAMGTASQVSIKDFGTFTVSALPRANAKPIITFTPSRSLKPRKDLTKRSRADPG